ncbi:MAG: sigma-54-dependent Fis family transcriptional regulator, partial [Desulfobacteraceae bacterium]|nr:sigma-54-dependent Fis family transcriptional regulator [Desulfobacteraceae bacterium]
GKFREDLYYRLNIIKIYVPPLRERPEDIEPLIEYYMQEYAAQLGGIQIERPNAAVIEKMTHYHWPGNVRELQNVLKRMLVLGESDKIIDELFAGAKRQLDVPAMNNESRANPIHALLDLGGKEEIDSNSFSLKAAKKKAVDRVEKEIISYVLTKTDWNRSKASRILKVSYKTLLNKITELNITPPSETGGFSQ